MSLYELLPTKKVSAFLLGGAVTIAVFWALIQFGPLEDWPESWVMASFALIAGFVFAWFVPPGVWDRVQRHLKGTVASETPGEPDTDIEGDVTLTRTGEGTAEIEGEVETDEDGEIGTINTGEIFEDNA